MANEEQLSDVLSEFAHGMLTDFSVEAILARLVKRTVDILPVSAAGVTLMPPGAPFFMAASDEAAMRLEELQAELGDGPCLTAHATGQAVAAPDLRSEGRYPRFTGPAIEAGLVAEFTFPLRTQHANLGALDLYRNSPGPLDDATKRAAQTLADVSAAYVLNAQAWADMQDVAERYRERAQHDPLTGLANRVVLLERLDHVSLRRRRSDNAVAVLFIDLDRFKMVNDQYGHQAGDALLVGVAERLSAVLRPGDTLARMSGDEFVILCEDVNDPSEVAAIKARIADTLTAPFALSGNAVQISASVGVAYAGRGDGLSEDLLQAADKAMYRAKQHSHDRAL